MVTKMLQLFGCARLRFKHSGAGLLSALLACAFLAGPALAADPRESGPRTLVITYHTSPANRLAFRQELEQSGVRQLQRSKDDGVLQSYRVLFNRYVDSANWDAMTMVTFAKESDIERWKKIELEAPAGLSQKALSLVTSIDTVPAPIPAATRLRSSEAPVVIEPKTSCSDARPPSSIVMKSISSSRVLR